MKITPPSNGTPPEPPSGDPGKPAAASASSKPEAAGEATGLPTVSRTELHGPQQPEILRQSLHALLDRAAGSLGSLPPASRAACAELLAADPFLSARLLGYLEQKAQ